MLAEDKESSSVILNKSDYIRKVNIIEKVCNKVNT